MNQTFMKEKKVMPLLLSMALPMVISMMVNSLYNIVDSYFVAQISEEAMTALSLVYPVQNFITSVGVGFGVGINAAIAFYLGAQDQKKANEAASQGLFLSVIHGIALTIICLAITPFFLKLFTKDATVIQLGNTYSRIAFSFSIIISIEITWEKIFQAVGRMRDAMICMVSGCVLNIVLDPIMIFGIGPVPKMGIAGAAIATGIGQVATWMLYLIFYHARPFPVHIYKTRQLHGSMDKKLYAVGIPATLNMALPSLLVTALNGILSIYSPIYVVVLGIYYKLQTFLYLPANGILQGMRPLIGYNYGAGEKKRVHKLFAYTLYLSLGIMLFGTILCQICPDTLIALFSSNPDTVNAGALALRIISLGFLVSSVSITCCGALEGLGKGTPSLVISLCRYTLIIIPAAFILSRIFGAVGVWYAFGITEAVTAVIAYVTYRRATRVVRW
ncbi:MAG: MATE family efflux transporter [Lachnospiraceae bacterium]|nr:MATE family efflux transporter [Lachnospiraceae bacterium]